MVSKCKKNYIINPNTGRCIQKNGATAKKINKSKTPSKPKSKKTKSPPKKSPRKSKPKKSPSKSKSKKLPYKPKKNESNCYTFNGVKICEHIKSRYFEEQKEALCGLHALNNLFQNQSLIPHPKLFTKQELDEECELFHKLKANGCYANGWYTSEILQQIVRKKLFLNTNIYIGANGFDTALNELKDYKNVIGAIVLYKAPHCGNHFVSLIPYGNKFLVVDSSFKRRLGHEDLQVIDTENEIKKYFFHILETLIIKKV